MIILKKNYLPIIILLLVITGDSLYCFCAFSQNQKKNIENLPTESQFNKWFAWKIRTNITEKQKTVIEYLKKSSTIFNKAFDTKCIQLGSKYGDANPRRAIKITKQAINELRKLSCPKECIKYRNLNIEIMKNIIIYHNLRIKFKEGTKEFDARHRKLQLYEINMGLDVEQYNEYFESMKRVGLFDNIEKEMKNSDIINTK